MDIRENWTRDLPIRPGFYFAVMVYPAPDSSGVLAVEAYKSHADNALHCRTVDAKGNFHERRFDEFILWSRRVRTGLLDEMQAIDDTISTMRVDE